MTNVDFIMISTILWVNLCVIYGAREFVIFSKTRYFMYIIFEINLILSTSACYKRLVGALDQKLNNSPTGTKITSDSFLYFLSSAFIIKKS